MRFPASLLARFNKRPHISSPTPNGAWSVTQDFTAGSATNGPPSATHLAPQAAALAARLPAILLQANRIAATLHAGQHGLRRAGGGESFWQYRQALPGEPVQHIDWRQSARSAHAYVRETEAQAPQTFLLWCDLSPSMQWRSNTALPEKAERAILLQLALAAFFLRSGERVRLLTPSGVASLPTAGTPLERLAFALLGMARSAKPSVTPMPPVGLVPRYSQLLIASDFLCEDTFLHATLRQYAGTPARAHLMHIADPAELSLPYKGHVTFEGLEHEQSLDLPHVQSLQQDYKNLIAARESALQNCAARYGHTLTQHCTDNQPLPALLALLDQFSAVRHRQSVPS